MGRRGAGGGQRETRKETGINGKVRSGKRVGVKEGRGGGVGPELVAVRHRWRVRGNAALAALLVRRRGKGGWEEGGLVWAGGEQEEGRGRPGKKWGSTGRLKVGRGWVKVMRGGEVKTELAAVRHHGRVRGGAALAALMPEGGSRGTAEQKGSEEREQEEIRRLAR